MLGIIDYSLGNIKAFSNILKANNIDFIIIDNKIDLNKATKLILPGVGAFDSAIKKIKDKGIFEDLNRLVTISKVPVLGICVGMQIMANQSEEGKENGFSWIDGEIKRFPNQISPKLLLPHMGWNCLNETTHNKLLTNIQLDYFYFLHSFYFNCFNKDDSLATSFYGIEFTSIVAKENIFGVQFHPEKSHEAGTQLIINFAKLC